MANRRDLHIGITGDSAGFDKACTDAEEKARGLDKELAKLERQQAAQEKITTRTTAAIDRFGKAQDKAALAARRLGIEAKNAADKAEKAEIRAAAAADAVSKGLLDEAKAAQIAARADDAVERAALKAAEAHRAAARAAEEQAQQERQLARDAELAAAAERLGVLKASRSVREHNALLRDLESRFGDLSKEGQGAFTAIESRSEKALQSIGSTAPGQIAIVIGALAAIPFAAAAAQTAVAGGLGGALIGVGLAATKSDKDVQAALTNMAAHVKETTAEISAPFKDTWLEIASTATKAFDELAPHLRKDFAELAPAVSQFVKAAGDGIASLGPALDSASHAAARLLASLSGDAPEIFDNLGRAVQTLADGAASNPNAIPNLVTNVSQLLPLLANLINYAEDVGPVFNLMYGVLTSGVPVISYLGDALNVLSFGLIGSGHGADAANKALPPLASNAQAAATATDKLGQDMRTLASSTSTAEDKTNALNDAFTRLLDPQLAAYQDTARLRQGIDDLTAALVKSHGQLGDNSQAARDAKDAFAGLLKDAEQFAGDLLRSGNNLDTVQGKLVPYILSLYKAAGANQQARQLVDAFVRSVGLVPPKKGTTLYSNAAQQKAAIESYQRQINSLKGRTVYVHTVYTSSGSTTFGAGNKKLGNKYGGPIHRAHGGAVGMAGGGPSGSVVGPGSGTSDDIPVWLSNGEYVVNAADTARNRPVLDAMNFGHASMADMLAPRPSPVPVGAGAAPRSASTGPDARTLAAAVAQALHGTTVQLDGKPVGAIVSRHLGQSTDLRRRTG
jgi:hypothetical protein